jgi:antitoxin MazE
MEMPVHVSKWGDSSRERALKRIRAFRKPLPADWKFDRGEANSR